MKNCCSTILLATAMMVTALSGCRQPVLNVAGQNRAPIFDFANRPRLFGGSSAGSGTSNFPQIASNQGSALGGGVGGGLGWGDTWRNRWLSGSGADSTNRIASNGSNSNTGFFRNRLFGGSSSSGPSTPTAGFDNRFLQQPSPDPRFGSGPIAQSDPRLQQQFQDLSGQVSGLNQRLLSYDTDNQLLHTELASLKQKLQLANDYNYQLKQQLAGSTDQIQSIQQEKSTTEQQLAFTQLQMQQLNQTAETQRQQFALQQQQLRNASANQNNNPNQLAGFRTGSGTSGNMGTPGATLQANNSLMQRFNQIRIPGGQARMDGDVIRIEFPSDRLFVPGRFDIQPNQTPMLQNLVQTIRENFPQQIIGVEAHWDNTPLQPAGTSHHQLTATQSLAVLNYLTRLGLPERQIFNMAMGSNRPRHNQAAIGDVSPNRRIEIVIYPESYNGT